MSDVVAGVDIGNSTTEVVFVDATTSPPVPLLWDRVATRGTKGTPESYAGGAALIKRMERRSGLRVDRVVATRQTPVDSSVRRISLPPSDSGRLAVIARQSSTPGGTAVTAGLPVRLVDLRNAPLGTPVVVLVPADYPWRAIAESVSVAIKAGVAVTGVLLEGDGAVLVANRLGDSSIAVLDDVDFAALDGATRIAMEIAAPAQAVSVLADPLGLCEILQLGVAERQHAAEIAAQLRGARNAAVAVLAQAPDRPAQHGVEVNLGSGWVDLFDSLTAIRAGDVGLVTAMRSPDYGLWVGSDLWAVDLAAVAASADVNPADRAIAVARANRDDDVGADAVDTLASSLDRPVLLGVTEARAAALGAWTTPGSVRGPVIDFGGGTIDLIAGEHVLVAAGAGELLTAAIAAVLGISNGAADWVKRGPSLRVESPHVVLAEDGQRQFTDDPMSGQAVGSLVVPGPAGWLPFDRVHAPAEWRILRRRILEEVLGSNLRRLVRNLDRPGDLLVVGGPAGGDETMALLESAAPGRSWGRANVAGVLGHRWAVAYGLTLAEPQAR